ncbi:histidine kinase [Sphingobium sp. BYY-5]|uniref:sensor histidine kinase n=1 Tax=Sphingobium sp. BYY-5 TaxID=2926400 RepID=UPI001FA76A87|nr:histidine kinase [Sphingobium sp. BYY-5]MCI4592108.1 histidine kinase [Sphingobium sp. BYY-5]
MEKANERAPFGGDKSRICRATLRLGLIYWAIVFISSSILWGIVGTDPIKSAMGKIEVYSISALIGFGLAALLYRLGNLSVVWKMVLCSALSILIAPVYALLDFCAYVICVYPTPISLDWEDFGYTMVYGASLFFGWFCMFLWLLYSFEIRDHEQWLAAAREESLSAQMRALRYQINPHFLFNTLNSIAGLVEEGAATQAERMILALSDFLRTTLTLDPFHDVRLEEELALQAGYLEIERERFSDRMDVKINVAPELHNALVPSLILQPLIENAVKHGVGGAPGKVEIVIRATSTGQSLSLSVENDAPPPETSQARRIESTGIGLKNVADRVAARFPGIGSFTAAHTSSGRFRASLVLPLRLA